MSSNRKIPISFILGMATALAIILATWALSACGYTEVEMQMAKDRQYMLEGELEKCYERYPTTPEEINHDDSND